MTAREFLDHSVHQKIEQLDSRLQEVEFSEKIEVDKQDFFKTAVKFSKQRLKITLPSLVFIAELNSVASEFETALNQINSFLGNGNQGHINNAINNISTALTYIKILPIPINNSEFNFSNSIATFQETISSKYNQTEKLQSELEERLLLTNEKLAEKEVEIKLINDNILLKQLELQNLSSAFQKQIDTCIANFTKQVADDRLVFNEEFDKDQEKIKLDSEETINDLERKLSDATRLVNAIGNVGVTGNYQIIANQHKDSADNWRYFAIGFMSILSILLICSIWNISDQAYDWHKAIIRIISATILIYPATYSARESNKHRRLENYNRKAELELAAINPFIEILDENKKQSIKEKLVDKYFGNNLGSDSDGEKNENMSIDNLEKTIKLLISATSK